MHARLEHGLAVRGRAALDGAVLEQWAAWDVRFGILSKRPVVDEAFAFDLG